METKTCKKCNIEKDLNDFFMVNKKPNSICKICKNEQSKLYRQNNLEKMREYGKNYNETNKETLIEYRQKFYKQYNKGGVYEKRRKESNIKNFDKIKVRNKEYRDKNKPKIQAYLKQYMIDNRERLNQYKNEYNKKNPHIKMWISLISNTLKRFDKPKQDKCIDLLGYSALELKEHIESLFTIGMTWDNYGEWHIDHIKPVSSFDENTPMDIVNALTNLQPLWATTREIDGIIYEGNLNKNKY